MALSHFIVLAFCAISVSLASQERCVQGVNCFLPDCFCPTFSHPMGAKNIPQIVYFGFDDAVTPELAQYFRKIFTVDRVNPNGCPITMSLFVCHRYTIYSLVSEFFSEYDEIAVHSVTHTFITTGDKLRQEATQQRRNIEYEANVPGGDIVGWRSPDLITAGDDQPKVLKQLNYTYDISLPFEEPGKYAFPYTLDYGYPYKCSVLPCPGKDSKHPGFWEVPINAHWDPVSGIPCCYVDGCRPETEEAAYQFLLTNFLASYNGERAPFGLNMHAAWFYWPKYFSAMERFVQTILNEYPETYIVSVSQMMAWMKTPQNIEQSKTFAGWDCPWIKAKQAQKAKAAVVEPPKPVSMPDQRTGLFKFVDPRLSLSETQKKFIKLSSEQPTAVEEEPKERTGLFKFVNPRLSLSETQKKFIKLSSEQPTAVEEEPEERTGLFKFVDPRLSLSETQKKFIKLSSEQPTAVEEEPEERTGLFKFVDPRLSLSETQKKFIKLSSNINADSQLNTKQPEEKSVIKASLLFKSMKITNNN